MRDDIKVYKQVGTHEYIIHTTMTNNGMIANVKWYVRERPYIGATKYKIIFEGDDVEVPMVKSRGVVATMQNRITYFKEQMDKHIDANKEHKDQVAEATAKAIETHDDAMKKFAPTERDPLVNKHVKQAIIAPTILLDDPEVKIKSGKITVSDVEE